MGDSRRRAAALFLGVLVALVATGCTAHGTEPVPTPADSLAARSQAVLDQAVVADAPGCAAAVGEHGKLLWQGVRGMADLESGTPISPDTIFDVGSVSKQFTATAVLLLANQGKRSTSDPLQKHLTGLPSWSRTVTLGQLMHHVSGTPEYMRLLEARGFTFPFEEKISCELELKVISEVEFLNFKPGSMWQYSNSNYLLLGTVVEKVSGQQLAEFLQRNIFGPLQLHMVVGSVSVRPGKARSYRVSSGTSGYEIADWHVDALGAGGIQSTPGTLVRWADNYRSGRLGGSQLLEAQLRGAEPTSEDVIGHEGTRYGAGIVSDSDGTLWHGGE